MRTVSPVRTYSLVRSVLAPRIRKSVLEWAFSQDEVCRLSAPGELEILYDGTERRTRFRQALPVGTTWGPFEGKIEMTTAGSDMPVPVVLTGGPRWLQDVTWLAAEDGKSNCVVYSIGGQLWCTTTKPIMEGEELAVFAVDFYSRLQAVNQAALSERINPARLLDSIRLLPQQAYMASILPNAMVNSKKKDEVSTGGTMKCTEFDHTADSLPSLQKHILSHLSQTGYRCSHCHFSFTSPRELDKHHEIHRHSFSYSVKLEPSSPRQASSSIQNNMVPAAFPMGLFLSHFPYSQDLRAAPQASEILAKMSELVHHRLRHVGTNHYPAHVMYSTLVPKGAMCFECNITFGNLDNYLIHKKHYCNSGWQHVAKPHDYTSVLDKVTDTGSPKSGGLGGLGSLNMSQGHLSDPNSHLTSPCLNLSGLDLFTIGEGKAQVQAELPGTVKNPSIPTRTDDNPSIQADVTSPKASQTPKTEILDPNKTTCEPCKITFSRTETYMVHKQYYCATRHDPLMKRAQSNKLPATQRTVRSRKRKKNFKMNIPNHEQQRSSMNHHPHYFGIASTGGPGMCQDPREIFGKQFHPRYNMFLGMVPKHPEANLPFTKSALISKCNAIAQDELDNAIDLSKTCSSSSPGKLYTTHKRLMDYHECTVCKISFNKVEDYLAHKRSSCPVTAPDRKTSAVVKRGGFNNPVDDNDTNLGKSVTNGANEVFLQIGSTNGDQLAVIKEESTDEFLSQEFSPLLFKKMRLDEHISTFYRIKPADYTTGTVVMQREVSELRQSPNEGSEVKKDQPMPDGYQETQGVLPQNGPQEPEDMVIDTENTLQEHKLVNSHLPDSHVSSLSDSESPVSVNSKKSTSSSLSSPAKSKTEDVLPSCVKRGLNGSIQATKCSVKYCRPCDIQFNNLSNFITHKKFYCSSHTAEHVK
ncbi:zinc finger protein ZFPM2-like [Salvelinus namaycush]|uniref:Zinc finger protein ZFPM2-like n=1 Tax=Salvelinus namaycush TaxID=8040 RepID=A0A8U0PP81_SALNM|nr:zinc finger protein ZFPM2-like [Salvelinus namaycush]